MAAAEMSLRIVLILPGRWSNIRFAPPVIVAWLLNASECHAFLSGVWIRPKQHPARSLRPNGSAFADFLMTVVRGGRALFAARMAEAALRQDGWERRA
jgi:hypothetical protein